MTSDMISMKLEHSFLKEIDKVVKSSHFHSRTEFIRESLRKSVEKEKLKQAILKINTLKGLSKNKVSHKDFEKMKDKAFDLLD